MLCYFYPEPTYLVYSPDVPGILYYAQIPTTLIALLFGFYIFWQGRDFLLNRLLFAISIFFTLWTTGTLISWTNIHSQVILFAWSFFPLILGLISISSIYFIYVFLNKKDITGWMKLVFFGLLLPTVILAPTRLYLSGFDIAFCDAFAFEWAPMKIYSSILGILAMVWILFLLVKHYIQSGVTLRRQIFLMGTGIELFLFSFFGTEFLGTYLTKIGLFEDSQLELYGLFGMVVFMLYIGFLVVKFGTFHIKMLATQALVAALVALVFSQYFFIKESLNFMLNSVSFVASIGFGYFLVRSVQREIQQREKIQRLVVDLEAANKGQQNLIHFITHQVKGFLTKSRNIFAGLKEGDFGPVAEETKPIIEEGFASGTKAVDTVQNILKAADIHKGTLAYEKKELNLSSLIKEEASKFEKTAQQKGIDFSLNIQEDILFKGDREQLGHVFRNLIDNAFKYTLEGSVSLTLQKEENIIFSIQDTGVGITPSDMKRLFTEGGKGENSTKVNVDSTGYGLFIVKDIVEKHGGKVSAESKGPGEGSTFTVEL